MYPDQTNEGYLADRQTLSTSILIDIRQPDFTIGQTYNTSSDPVSAALNDLLTPLPVSAGADASDAIEAGGINNGTIGSNAIGNVLSNDAGGLTSYTVIKNVTPMLMVTNAASVTLSTFTSSQSGATGTVPAQVVGQYGTLQLNANGSFVYTVNNNNSSVQALRTASNTLKDVYTYKIASGSDQAIGTLTITIKGANDNPVAVNDYNTAKAPANPATVDWTTETLGSKATGNVLTNDTDVDNGDTKAINPLTGSATVSSVTILSDPTYNFTTSNGWTSVKTGFYAYLLVSNQYRALRTSSGVPITIIKDATSFRLSGVPAQVYSGTGTNYIAYAGIAVSDQIGFDDLSANSGPNNSKYAIVASINTSSQTSTVTINQPSIQGLLAIGMDAAGTGVPTGAKISNILYDANGTPTTIYLDKAITSSNGTSINFTANTGTEIQGRYGTLSLNSDGSYIYTPTSNPGVNVTVVDPFPYTMQDLAQAQSSATLYITLVGTASQDPNASPITANAFEAGGINNGTAGTDPTGNILGNSPQYVTSPTSVQVTAIKTNQESTGSMIPGTTGGVTYNGSKAGLYGTLYAQSTGVFKYVVNNSSPLVESLKSGQSLTEVFNYQVTNSSGIDWSTITITINGAYDNPVAVADVNTAIVGITNPSGEVLPNDTDVDANDTKVVSKVIAGNNTPTTSVAVSSSSISNPTTINGSYGSLKIGSDGSYNYTINNSNPTVQALASINTLTDVFTYEVKDGGNLVSNTTITITISAPNKAPVNTNPSSVTTAVAVGFSFSSQNQISVNDVDNNLYSVTLSVENGTFALTDGTAKSGLLTYTIKGTQQQINAVLATLVYTSNQGFNGTDVLTIESIDTQGLSHTTTVNIVVSASNLTVSNETVNEGSPYIVFSVSGTTGQLAKLSLASGTGTNGATLATDFGPNLEYYNGTSWVAYTANTQVALPASGVLLVRTSITNDATYEVSEVFKLIATNTANANFEGIGTIKDDGTGNYFSSTSTVPVTPPTALDDDRALSVNSITVNEGSPYAVFEVSGAANQLTSLALANVTTTGITGLSYSTDGGLTWNTYTSGNVALNATGKLLVRTSLTPEQEAASDNGETFTLTATNTGGTPAVGTATVKDDGTGTIFNNDGTSNTTATKDDDRALSVNNITVNEGSPYAVFEVSGAANQLTSLALANVTTTGITGLSYSTDGGLTWNTYTSGNVALNATGKLLVRTSLTPEQEAASDNGETFTLTATNTGGTPAVGTATVKDDGTGTIFNNDGTSNTTATKDDDRALSVNSITVNEGSPYAVFEVSGAANQLTSLALANVTTTDITGLSYSTDGGLTWNTYTSGNVALNASGKLLVRTSLTPEQEAAADNGETFTLTATNTGGTPAVGTATVKDDGTGTIFNNDGTSNTTATKDDDRALSVNSITVNEGSPYAVFEVSGAANQLTSLALANVTTTDITGLSYSTDGGLTWNTYTSGNVALNATGKLLVRTSLTPEQEAASDNGETFTLTATNTGGTPAVGTATVKDDGTGTIFNNDGTSNTTATKDDDRALSVNNITVNEGSPYAVFQVSGAANQLATLSLSNGTAGAADYGSTLEYYNGTAWVAYIAGSNVALDTNGKLWVRTPIKQDVIYEGAETFKLTATNTGGTGADGIGTIMDDGTGSYWIGAATAPATLPELFNAGITLDDDRLKVFADKNVTFIGVQVDGSVATNDVVAPGSTYGTPVAATSNPTGGQLTLNADGTYVFKATLPGEYLYDVPVCGPGQTTNCPTAQLQITVIAPLSETNIPVINPDLAITEKGTPVNVNVLANDRSGNYGKTLSPASVAVTTQPANGTAVVNSNGTITYTPNANYTGNDVFTYKVCETGSTSICQTTEVYITVMPAGVRYKVTASDDYNTMSADWDGVATVTGSVLTNDGSTQANPTLSVSLVTGPSAAEGTIVLNSNGTYTFKPKAGFSGSVDVVYTVCDNATPASCATATLHILVVMTDSDGDGVSDIQEIKDGTDPKDPCSYKEASQNLTTVSSAWKSGDCDGDGVPNGTDTKPLDPCVWGTGNPTPNVNNTIWQNGDCDSDGIPNKVEGIADQDGDGIPNYRDVDSDGDGLLDKDEAGANPLKPRDTDGDGLPDYLDLDSDNDGITDAKESGGNVNLDTDKDGIPDHMDLDADGDGISDVIEADGADTDQDGRADGTSDAKGIPTSAKGGLTPPDTDKDGKPDFQDLDTDGDGIPDNREGQGAYIAPKAKDTDGDGLDDAYDKSNGGTYIIPVDTDKDGKPDWRDLDSDNDGIPDADEKGPDGNNPIDTDKDGSPDYRDVDSDNNGIPDNETLLIWKTASKPVLATDGSYTLNYTITVRNERPEAINNVQIKEDLTLTFPSPMSFQVMDVKSAGILTKASGFDGRTNVNLLASGITLNGKQQDSIILTIKIYPNGYSGDVNNTAEGSAVTKWFPVVRQSIDITRSGGRLHGAGLPTISTLPLVNIFIADVLTPNNDGKNDAWIILRPSNIKVGVTIFNRWGQVVYKSADYRNDWYGTSTNGFSGNILPGGTYLYIVELSGGTIVGKDIRKGYMTLIRE